MAEDKEKNMIKEIFDFGKTQIGEIMTKRNDIIYFQLENTLADILPVVKRHKYSRYPVIGESIDDVKGIIQLKEIITELDKNDKDIKLKKIIKPALFISETKNAVEFLKKFQSKNVHMAIVIKNDKKIAGLITLEDLLEEIVGDIK